MGATKKVVEIAKQLGFVRVGGDRQGARVTDEDSVIYMASTAHVCLRAEESKDKDI